MIEAMKLRVVTTLFFLGFLTVAYAQERQNFQWIQYYLTYDFSDRTSIRFDGGPRWRSFFEETSQYVARASVGRQINDNWKSAVGFANVGYLLDGNVYRYEWRSHVEVSNSRSSNKLKWQHRLRLELRNYRDQIDGANQSISKSSRLRPRYRLQTVWPMGIAQRWEMILGDEILIHVDRDDGVSFSQNRVLFGPQYAVNDHFALSFLLNWEQTGLGSHQYRNDYVFWLRVNHDL
jgi:hypothetical protein